MIRRMLVTGGAGFIGSHLVDRLVDEGNAVTVLDDFSSGDDANLTHALEKGDVRIVAGSVLDRVAVDEALVGCGTVFHLAVKCVRRSLGHPLESHEVNAGGTLNVLERARHRELDRFVYCSSSEVYGNASGGLLDERTTVCSPTTVYGAAKLAGEHYAKAYHRAYGLPTVIVRPFNAYGPREHHQGELAEVIPRFVIRVLSGLPPIIFGRGDNARDFTYVTDSARGLAMAARCDALIGREVNIARGRCVSIEVVARTVCRLCQRPDLEPVLVPPRPGDIHVLHADIHLAREVLGYTAEIEFERGLEKYLQWFSEAHPDPSALLEADPVNWELPA